jgi:SNF2 family DNA or RNA helicase/HJR/Mrr/RecB family endonuclease
MFSWKYDNTFSFFIFSEKGDIVSTNTWEQYRPQYLAQFSIINEFLDNGLGVLKTNHVEIEALEILNLSDIERKILGLPDDYPFVIFIENEGLLNQKSLKFKYSFFDFVPHGSRIFLERNGPIVENEEFQFLLSPNQYSVLEIIKNFNNLPDSSKSFPKNLSSFSEIKGFSDDEETLLDDFLKGQHVLNPEKIKIDISFDDDILELKPKIESIEQNSLEKAFDLTPIIKDVYNVKNLNGETTRVIIEPRQKEQLAKIKSNRKVTSKEKIDALVDAPELIFDDEVIDLELFSRRVREIGLYKPKFYPFICPYKSEWIPGIVIKGKEDGEKRIHFKTPEQLENFENQRNEAIKRGDTHFTYKGEEISTEGAVQIIDIAKRQFADPKKPIDKGETPLPENVLIIKENADLLEYSENNETPFEITHTFYSINNLKPSISLKNHQKEGVAWLQSLYNKSLSGCLLADDMGLGKTLQILFFLEWHAQMSNETKPYLIVAPVSILENWEREYKYFFTPKNLEVQVLNSSSGISREFDKNIINQFSKKKILLTNYEFLRIYQINLCAIDYSIVVLDEAQKIKTPGTLITNVTKALKADFKIAMTGTPVENTLVDIWCIMDFSIPGLLGNAKDFSKSYQNPLKREDTDVKALGEDLRSRIGVFIKRRLKKDVATDLPRKEKVTYKKVMPDKQLKRYNVEIELAKNEGLEGIDKRNQILKSLWAIRDISDHPDLVDSQVNLFSSKDLIKNSAKLQILIEVLEKVKSKSEKAIIFADRKGTQKMIQKVIHETFYISPPSIINGDTPSTKQKENSQKLSRQQTIDRFQSVNGFNVIIMSQLAAGVGLNVVEANHVIHYSRHWNPAKEEQATDRAYRIGQKKDVYVYYPMAIFPDDYKGENGEKLNSFDEVLDKLLSRKMELASNTLFPTEKSEVRPDEIYGGVFGGSNGNQATIELKLEEIDKLEPKLFEAFVAALYAKMDFDVTLTPFSNDKGADVVAIGSKESFLIQVKQSQTEISNKSVQEIVTAKGYYEKRFGENFKLLVLTNQSFGPSAKTLANSNEVDFIDRQKLKNLLSNYSVSITDVQKQESQRRNRI